MIEKNARVCMSPMWKYNKAIGTVIKLTKEYTVVSWDNINGEWHYTKDQAKRLEVISEEKTD